MSSTTAVAALLQARSTTAGLPVSPTRVTQRTTAKPGHSRQCTSSSPARQPPIGNSSNYQIHNFQITGVWGIDFANGWLTNSGFIDFWREYRPWQDTSYILLSEIQLWVNLNKIKGWENIPLSVGGEVELSNNFVDRGFYAIPTLAAKWTF